jgi:hypothetical protein
VLVHAQRFDRTGSGSLIAPNQVTRDFCLVPSVAWVMVTAGLFEECESGYCSHVGRNADVSVV